MYKYKNKCFLFIFVIFIFISGLLSAVLSEELPSELKQKMHFVVVRSNIEACEPVCAEWIMAQGEIYVGAAAEFERLLKKLGPKRLPLFINSQGGSADDGEKIGRLLRKQGMDVVVARTKTDPCVGRRRDCIQTYGTADEAAFCISACTFILAGGVDRMATPYRPIAVHHVKMDVQQYRILKQYQVYYRMVDGQRHEVSRKLLGETRQLAKRYTESAGKTAESAYENYFTDMGIGPQIAEFMANTPFEKLHILTPIESAQSKLVTHWLGGAVKQVELVKPEWLVRRQIEIAAKDADIVGDMPLEKPVAERKLVAELKFGHATGANFLVLQLAIRDGQTHASADIRGTTFKIWFGSDAQPLVILKSTAWTTLARFRSGDNPWVIVVSKSKFCNIGETGSIKVEVYDGPNTHIDESQASLNPHQPPVIFSLGEMNGKAFYRDICERRDGSPQTAKNI